MRERRDASLKKKDEFARRTRSLVASLGLPSGSGPEVVRA